MHSITVSLLRRRLANQTWHALSELGFMQVFTFVAIDAPYQCFFLAPPRDKPNLAHPITA